METGNEFGVTQDNLLIDCKNLKKRFYDGESFSDLKEVMLGQFEIYWNSLYEEKTVEHEVKLNQSILRLRFTSEAINEVKIGQSLEINLHGRLLKGVVTKAKGDQVWAQVELSQEDLQYFMPSASPGLQVRFTKNCGNDEL